MQQFRVLKELKLEHRYHLNYLHVSEKSRAAFAVADWWEDRNFVRRD